MTIDPQLVSHIANLANIPVTDDEKKKLARGFTTTLGVVDTLSLIDTSQTSPTHQVTGLENVFRDDRIDVARMFSQEEALMNAKQTHNGYVVVEQIICD